jgi:ABC-2 type transport system ATP-binding protein
MKAVDALDLYKRFGSIVAVDSVSFQVEEGEIFGLLGPNGAGKTTTIRMLTGILKPDGGEARIMGYNIHKDPVKARMLIGVVPEEANPYPDLSAWDNLMLVGRLYGLPKHTVEDRASSLLRLLDLYDARKRRAGNLSKGMRQKLLVAMALIGEPKVLFLDEPTSGLDVLSARKIRSLILDLKKNGDTILLTTHNVEEAGALCDRILIINGGRVVEMGTPEDLRIKSGLYTYVSVTLNRAVDEKDAAEFFDEWDYRIQDSRILFVCSDPTKLMVRIVEYAKAKGLNIVNISTEPPSLEDVFVKVIAGG